MAVRPDSVVPLWVDTFNHPFYVALTDQEEYLYDEAELIDPATLEMAIDAFQLLVDELDGYIAASSPSRSAGALNAIPSFLYTYNMYRERFGMTEVADSLLDAKSVFNMGGFMATVIARPTDYYDDFIEDPLSPGDYASVKLAEDVEFFTDASNWMVPEASGMSAVEGNAVGGVRAMNQKALWSGLPTPPDPPIVPKTKQELAEWIFLTLNWKWVKDTFPAASGMDIPDIITSPPPGP